MKQIKHLYITVNSDMKKEHNFEGTLADLACEELTRIMYTISGNPNIISITETYWTGEVRLRMDNSRTWYNRNYLKLSVYYEVV